MASLPSSSVAGPEASLPPPVAAAASVPPAAAASAPATASAKRGDSPPPMRTVDEYPQTVQELVMNGFELRKVVRAYELVGDGFDDLLGFLMANTS